MKTTAQIVRKAMKDDDGTPDTLTLEDERKEWVAVDDLKELIRRNKMDEDELKWNKCHPDWNKSLLLIENALCEEDKEE